MLAQSSRPVVAFWIISLLAALDTLVLSYRSDGGIFSSLALGYFIAVLLVETLLLVVSGYKKFPSRLQPLLAAVFATANLISVKLAFSEELLSLGTPAKAGLALLIAVILYVFTIQAWAAQKRVLLLLTVSLGAYAFVQPFTPEQSETATELFGYDKVQLREKPNVHVIAFDAMIPGAIAEKNLGVSVGYQTFLEKNAIVFRNAFSVSVPTAKSLNALLRLDDDRLGGYKFFSGVELSPVFAIFRNNGYEIRTGFSSSYFGPKGSYVDVYRAEVSPFPFSGTTTCLDKNSTFLGIPKFWRLCKRKELEELGKRFFGAPPAQTQEWPSEVQSVVSRRPDGKPVFTFHYILEPIGHTSKSFSRNDSEQLREYSRYFAEQAERLMAYLASMRTEVLKADPNAVVLIFGDHGVWLSQGAKYEDDPEYFVLDRHAVSLSVLKTNNRCTRESSLISTYISTYATPSQVLAGIIRCISREPEAMDAVVNFSKDHAFEKFRYED